MKNLKIFISVLLVSFIASNSFPVPASANEVSEPRLIEADEDISPHPPLSGIQNLIIRSPYRSGDVGGGGDDWDRINAQYNQPRPSSVGRIHRGVDLRGIDLNTQEGRPIFSVWGGKVLDKSTRDSYGDFISVLNEYQEGTITFQFETFFCHLNGVPDIPLDQSVTTATQIGITGNTGHGTGIHLHMELRRPRKEATPNTFDRRYAPSVLYSKSHATWGNDTSFINFAGTSEDTVTFRIVDICLGERYVVQNVRIYHRRIGTIPWSSANMIQGGDHFSYTFTGYPVGTHIEYYINAESKSWDGTYRTTYRPYQFSDGTPPTNRPFFHTMGGSTPTAFSTKEPRIPGYTYPIVEWDPSWKEVPLTDVDPFVYEIDFVETVLLERWVNNYTILAKVVKSWDSSGKPKLGKEVYIKTPGRDKGFETLLMGATGVLKGKVVDKKPLTVYIPSTDFIMGGI